MTSGRELATRGTNAVNHAAAVWSDQAWRMRLAGYSYRQIRDLLESRGIAIVTHQAVRSCILVRLKAINDDMIRTAPTLLAQEISRIDAMIATVWPRAHGDVMRDDEGEVIVDESTGKPKRYDYDRKSMETLLKLVEQRAKFLGVDVKRIELTGANGGPVQTSHTQALDVSKLGPAEVAMLELLLERATPAKAPEVLEAEFTVAGDEASDPESEDEPEGED